MAYDRVISGEGDDVTQASKSEVESILEPYAARLSSIAVEAWHDWMTSDRQYWRAKRSRANFVWEEMIQRAHLAFAGDPRVTILPRHESFLFILDGTLVFRLKKGDEAGAACNVPTQAALAFADPQRDLAGIPEATRVDILYVLNRLESAVIDVRVVARNREQIAWQFSLMPEADVVPMPLPEAEHEVVAPARRSLVRAPKAAESDKTASR